MLLVLVVEWVCEGRGVPMHRRSVLEVVVVGDAVVCGQVRWLRLRRGSGSG